MFTGSGVALITPMKSDAVNFSKIEELIEFHIQNGTDAVIICGTTGEASTLSNAELIECIRVAVQAAAQRIPVIAGTGKNSTKASIELSIEAQKAGADGLLVVTPYYNKTTQKGLVEHYRVIAESVELPVIVYNVPSRTGMNVEPETMARLCEIKNIAALKDAGSNIVKTAETTRLCGNRLIIYSGNDNEIIPIMSLGGKGVISVVANIIPKDVTNLTKQYLAGHTDVALSLQLEMLPLVAAIFSEVNPIPVKAAMNLMGFDAGVPRLPLVEMSAGALEKLRLTMLAYGIEISKRGAL